MKVLKLSFPMVQNQDGNHFVLFFNCLDHKKNELLASLDYLIHKHNNFSFYVKNGQPAVVAGGLAALLVTLQP